MLQLHPSVAFALLPAVSPLACLSSSMCTQVSLGTFVSLLTRLGLDVSPLGRDRFSFGIQPSSLMLCVDSSPQVACRLIEGLVLPAVIVRLLVIVVVVLLTVFICVRGDFSPFVLLMVVPARSGCVQELSLSVRRLIEVRGSGSCGGGAA